MYTRQATRSKCKRTRQAVGTNTHRKWFHGRPVFRFLQTCQHLSTAASRLSTDGVLGRSDGYDM
ncbi:hypothetical protein Taro_032358, partial [Colocasia esculenta]|nr:hypothetical protein [Colocasia esculenta]